MRLHRRVVLARIAIVAAVLLWAASATKASHVGFAPCPATTPGSSPIAPPTREVVVKILSVRVDPSIEPDDLGFITNRADVYGWVTIGGGARLPIPEVSGSDFPHWDEDGDGRVSRVLTGTANAVEIEIAFREADGELRGDDEVVDINPAPDRRT